VHDHSLLVEVVDNTDDVLKLLLALLSHVLVDGDGLAIDKVEAVLLVLSNIGSANGATEEVLVLLLREVNVIITVGVRELGRVVAIILEVRVRTHVAGLTMFPGLDGEVGDGAALVEVGDDHGTLVGVVVDHLGAQVPLLLFAEALQHVVGAHLHDGDLVREAGLARVLGGALLVLADLLVATAGDVRGTQRHVLGGLHDGGAHGAVLVAESLVLAVGVPVIVGLVVSVVLLEGVVQVTVQPVELRNHTEVEGHLSVLVGCVVVASTDRVQFLVEIGVDNGVTQVVVGLLPVVLGEVRRVEVDCCHIIIIIQLYSHHLNSQIKPATSHMIHYSQA